MNSDNKDTLSYRDAGVDIELGTQFIEGIKPLARRTHRPGVMAGVGGFGALFEIPADRYTRPILVSGADGVGTKLRIAVDAGIHQSIGIDLVAMCVNDIVVYGAEPLYFLDYLAVGRLDVDVAHAIVDGIARGCELAGAALIGGETAEMPGFYAPKDYDLAGFCVGIVEKDQIIDGRRVQPGDALVGMGSSGPHANGYSLIRRILDRCGADLEQRFEDRTLGKILLEPTRIYARPVLALVREVPVRAIAHITGGGITDNLPRVLPAGTAARIEASSWHWPSVFQWLQAEGNIHRDEMYRTFNCGVGMVVCVPSTHTDKTVEVLQKNGLHAWCMGTVEAAARGAPRVLIE